MSKIFCLLTKFIKFANLSNNFVNYFLPTYRCESLLLLNFDNRNAFSIYNNNVVTIGQYLVTDQFYDSQRWVKSQILWWPIDHVKLDFNKFARDIRICISTKNCIVWLYRNETYLLKPSKYPWENLCYRQEVWKEVNSMNNQ